MAGICSRIGGAVGDGSLLAATAAGAPATGARGADAAALGPGGPPGARRTRIRTAIPASAAPPPPSSARSQARRGDAWRSRRAGREASGLIGSAGYRHGLGAVRENPGATALAVPEDGCGRASGGDGGRADRQRDPVRQAGGASAASLGRARGHRFAGVPDRGARRGVVAAVGLRHVREARKQVDSAAGGPVGDLGGRRVRRVAAVHQGIGDAGEGAKLDRDDVVLKPPAVREAGRVPADQAGRVGDCAGGMAMLSRRRSAWVLPPSVTFWKPGTIPAGRPVRKMATRSARCLAGGIDSSLAFSASRLGNTPGTRLAAGRPAPGRRRR